MKKTLLTLAIALGLVLLDLKRLKSKGTYFAKVLNFHGNVIAIKKLIYQ